MELSEIKKREYIKRLLLSRMRILCDHGFYGLLLMHMKFMLDEDCRTAATDGVYIYFGPEFLEELTDEELDFIMMHEVMHCVLKHCLRGVVYDSARYNIAADIVVNSNILLENNMDLKSISVMGSPSMHITPNNDEGHLYTAEEVYEMLKSGRKRPKPVPAPGGTMDGKRGGGGKRSNAVSGSGANSDAGFDDHSKWGTRKTDDNGDDLDEIWTKRALDAASAIEIQDANSGRETMPLLAKRTLKELREPQMDWRTLLHTFIQEDICDYSFSPPDRRYEGPFLLPDFSDNDYEVKNVLFMIDASGSMSDDAVTVAYSEVKGAVDIFDGKLKGWLGYFDAAVVEPVPFKSVDDLVSPTGGGGTDFGIIFKYIDENMSDNPPATIIILTDGYAPYPEEAAAKNVPVLWLIVNDDSEPPWGRVARLKV